jgi:hypothetical protein
VCHVPALGVKGEEVRGFAGELPAVPNRNIRGAGIGHNRIDSRGSKPSNSIQAVFWMMLAFVSNRGAAQSAQRLLKKAEIRARRAELEERIAVSFVAGQISDRKCRMALYQDLAERLHIRILLNASTV